MQVLAKDTKASYLAACQYNAPAQLTEELRRLAIRRKKELRAAVRVARKQYECSAAERLVDLASKNPEAFYKLCKPAKRMDDDTLSLATLQRHFETLYGGRTGVGGALDEAKLAEARTELRRWHASAFGARDAEQVHALLMRRMQDAAALNSAEEFTITEAEVLAMFEKLGNHKACGVDRMHAELLKYAKVPVGQDHHGRIMYYNVLVTPITQMFNHIVATGMIPEAWGVSLLTAIYKGKGDPAQPNNYRGIAVSCALAKVFAAVIEARLSTFLEEHGLRAAGQVFELGDEG
jgi:hypothetical protein